VGRKEIFPTDLLSVSSCFRVGGGRGTLLCAAFPRARPAHPSLMSSSSPPAPDGGPDPSPSLAGLSLSSQISGGRGGGGGGGVGVGPAWGVGRPSGARLWSSLSPEETELQILLENSRKDRCRQGNLQVMGRGLHSTTSTFQLNLSRFCTHKVKPPSISALEPSSILHHPRPTHGRCPAPCPPIPLTSDAPAPAPPTSIATLSRKSGRV